MHKSNYLFVLMLGGILFLSGCFFSGKANTLIVTPSNVELCLNTENPTAELIVVVQDDKGEKIEVKDRDIKWVIENVLETTGLVASLDKTTGSRILVEGKNEGKALITVTFKSLSATIPIVVTEFESVATIAHLSRLSEPKDGDEVYVQGYWQVYDGGGGLFRYDTTNNQPADGGMIITSNNKQARWLRVVANDEPINIRWYGARSDIEQCQGAYLQAAIDYFYKQQKPGTVLIPAGTFSMGRRLGLYEGVNLIGEGIDISIIKNISSNYNSFINRTYHYSPDRYLNLTLSDLTIDVNMYNLGSWIGAIWIEDYFRNLTIERVRFTNSGGNIIRLMKDSVIADSIWDNMDGRALSTGWENKPNLRFRNNEIRNNVFIRTASSPKDPGINLSRAENNIVVGNQVININPPGDSYGGIRLPNDSHNNIVENNIVKNFARGIWILSGSQNNVVRGNTIIDSWTAALFINSSHENKINTSGNTLMNNIIIQENPRISNADLIRVHEDFSTTIIDNVVQGNEVRITSSYYEAYRRGKTLTDSIVSLTGGAEKPGRNTVQNNVLLLTD